MKKSLIAASLAATVLPIHIAPDSSITNQVEFSRPTTLAQQKSGHNHKTLGSILDRITSIFSDTGSESKLFSDEASAEMNQYSQLHSEYADYKQEKMPEINLAE